MTNPKGCNPGSATIAYVDPGHWSTNFGLSLRNLWIYDMSAKGRLFHEGGEIRKHCPSGGLVAARNSVVTNFLDRTCGEWLFFVDSDMAFEPDTLDRLIASAEKEGVNVMGGLCFGILAGEERALYASDARIVPTMYQWLETPDGGAGFASMMNYKPGEIHPVGATGSACILIHRGVLVDLREHLGSDTWYHPVTHPTAGPGGTPREFSEDLSFCVKAAQIGARILVDTTIKTSHDKGPGAVLDEVLYWQDRRNRGEVEE